MVDDQFLTVVDIYDLRSEVDTNGARQIDALLWLVQKRQAINEFKIPLHDQGVECWKEREDIYLKIWIKWQNYWPTAADTIAEMGWPKCYKYEVWGLWTLHLQVMKFWLLQSGTEWAINEED